jgi:hypothetical protein
MLFLLISAGLIGCCRYIFSHQRLPTWSKVGVALLIVYYTYYPIGYFSYTGWLIAQDSQKDPFIADAEFNNHTEQPIIWTRTGHQHAEPPVTVMWGPTHQLPIWRLSDTLNLIRTPAAEVSTPAELQDFLERADVAYIIADDEMLDRIGELGPAVGLTQLGDGRLQIGDVPSDWALGYVSPDILCRMCIFRRISAKPAIEPVDFVLADSIKLFGYEIDETNFQPAGELVVNLYWESEQPVDKDYTIFTQLLGPDFKLHGQLDRQPLAGHWPTNQWLSGQKFLDKFIIPVDETAPMGDYTLLIGLYDLQTGQRATATSEGQSLPDNAISHKLIIR